MSTTTDTGSGGARLTIDAARFSGIDAARFSGGRPWVVPNLERYMAAGTMAEPEGIRQWMGRATIAELLAAKTPSYQAPLQTTRVRTMAREFDLSLFGTAEVRIDDAGEWVLEDGQHRSAAGRAAGAETAEVDVRFTTGISDAEAARHFFGINSRKSKPRGALIRALAEAGDPLPVEMMTLAEKHGFRVEMLRESIRAKDVLNCPSTLLAILKDHGTEHLDAVLYVIRKAWNGDADSTIKEIVQAVSQFMLVYRDLGLNEIAAKLGTVAPRSIRAEVAGARISERGSSLLASGYAYGRGVLQVWNHGRRGNRLEDRFNEYDFAIRSRRHNRG